MKDDSNDCHLKPGFSVAHLAAKYGVEVAEVRRRLAKGARIEMEHTSDHKTATRIASQHVEEKLDYYDKLDESVVDKLIECLLG